MRQGGGKFAASRSPGEGPVELAALPSSGGVEVAACASASPGGARCRHRWEERQTGIEPRWAVDRRHAGGREPLRGSLGGHAVVVAEHRGPRDASAKKKRDPNAKKPQDWDDQEYIPGPEDKKPEGYDDIPKEIIYLDVTKHEDWDEEEYGEWTAPTIPNVDYKGPWTQKKIKNPNYKGKWKAPLIDNPVVTLH